jgi:dihydroxyacetone kinase phosphotransfer subunit
MLAQGLKEIAQEMADGHLKIVAAGGLNDKTMGTNAERIFKAIKQAWSPDGVLILFDLGSALISTEVAIGMLSPEERRNVIISNAPMVEGTIVAAVEASLGRRLERVKTAAEATRNMPKIT